MDMLPRSQRRAGSALLRQICGLQPDRSDDPLVRRAAPRPKEMSMMMTKWSNEAQYSRSWPYPQSSGRRPRGN